MTDRANQKRVAMFGLAKPDKIDIACRLIDIQRWTPVLWVAKAAFEANVRQRFPEVVFQPSTRGVNDPRPTEFELLKWPLVDVGLAERMARHENTLWPLFLRQTLPARLAYGLDLRDLYFRQLTFWSCMLREVEPELVFFSSPPHHFPSYAVYRISREMGARTICYYKTRLPGGLRLPVETFEDGSWRLRNRLAQIVHDRKEITLDHEIDEYLLDIRGDYSAGMPDYIKRKFSLDRRTGLLKARIDARRTDRFRNYVHLALAARRIKSLPRIVYEARRIRAREQLRRAYERRAGTPDPSVPYVSVMLHQQPEASTSPIGGPFVHQLFMIDLLARHVPCGWRIYVKEHPSQLHWGTLNPMFRTAAFYDKIMAYENVSLVSSREPSFRLIDTAQAIATVTGRVGWEAVNRNKPALVFGHPWYRDCPGVLRIHDDASCHDAFRRIRDGFHVDLSAVRAFVRAVCDVSVPTFERRNEPPEGGDNPRTDAYAQLLAERLPFADELVASGSKRASRPAA